MSKDSANEPIAIPAADVKPPQITRVRADTLSTRQPISGAETNRKQLQPGANCVVEITNHL